MPDAAIGIDGRQVRCANCKHSWHQEGPALPPAPPAPAIAAPLVQREELPPQATPAAPLPESPSVSAPSVSAPPVAVPPVPAPLDSVPPPAPTETPKPAVAQTDTPVQTGFAAFDNPPQPPPSVATSKPEAPRPAFDELPERSQFAHEPPFKPRRNPAKMWTMAAVAFAVLIAIGSLALWQFGVPTGSFATNVNEPDLKIVLNPNHELNYKPDGTPYFIASGTVVNPTSSEQSIPAMLVTLKDAGGRSVYSWKMKAKAAKIAPGGKVDFSEAQLDVPRAASSISISWVLSGD